MKIYVLLGGENNEGYSQPLGLFSSKNKAIAKVKKVEDRFDFVQVMEYEIDSKLEPKQVHPKIKPLTKKQKELYMENVAKFIAVTKPIDLRELIGRSDISLAKTLLSNI